MRFDDELYPMSGSGLKISFSLDTTHHTNELLNVSTTRCVYVCVCFYAKTNSRTRLLPIHVFIKIIFYWHIFFFLCVAPLCFRHGNSAHIRRIAIWYRKSLYLYARCWCRCQKVQTSIPQKLIKYLALAENSRGNRWRKDEEENVRTLICRQTNWIFGRNFSIKFWFFFACRIRDMHEHRIWWPRDKYIAC